MSTPTQIPDPNDGLAKVILYRHQFGCLPGENGHTAEEFDAVAGLYAMSNAIEKVVVTDEKRTINLFNVVSVLRYAAKLLAEKEAKPILEPVVRKWDDLSDLVRRNR